MHVLGTGVPRFSVARSASSPKAAQALGCSLNPGLRISFGRVTCMAWAASVPGLWTLGGAVLRVTDAEANNWLPPVLRSALTRWRYRWRNPPPPQPQPPHKRQRR